ncbi:DNA-processing protein DprA, partial [Glaciihabitans sp. dw_435]|uniref:DNA-processing protein DprA n=1 Tax=Glaciihabitans sp. dw_435 TaxID=2720081 RepID=UPI001BD2D467
MSYEVDNSVRNTRLSDAGMVWDAEMVARVAWACIAKPGDPAMGALIAAHGAAAALEVVVSSRMVEWKGFRLRPIRAALRGRFSPVVVRRVLEATVREELTVLIPGRPGWPSQLDDLGPAMPMVVWVRGDAGVLSRPAVAVTGTRQPTAAGVHEVLDAASLLADRGYVIISSAAPGIDTLAIRASLVIEETAVAVIPAGIAHAATSDQGPLLTEVAARGVVVSEQPPWAVPDAETREARDRIVAALAGRTVAVDTG